MTADALYSFLRTWISTVTIPAVSIIRSHQEAPAPALPYIVIQFAPNSRTRIGRPSAGDVDTDTGARVLVNDYEIIVEIWEVGGLGDRLQTLVDSVYRVDIQELFKANKISYMGEGPINDITQIQGTDRWRKEHMVEIRLNIASGITDLSSWIATLEYSGEIPAQGRSGDPHEITNVNS